MNSANLTGIPIALPSLAMLEGLLAIKPAASQHEGVTRLQELFQAEFEGKWAALRRGRRACQPSPLGADAEELDLGSASVMEAR